MLCNYILVDNHQWLIMTRVTNSWGQCGSHTKGAETKKIHGRSDSAPIFAVKRLSMRKLQVVFDSFGSTECSCGCGLKKRGFEEVGPKSITANITKWFKVQRCLSQQRVSHKMTSYSSRESPFICAWVHVSIYGLT